MPLKIKTSLKSKYLNNTLLVRSDLVTGNCITNYYFYKTDFWNKCMSSKISIK